MRKSRTYFEYARLISRRRSKDILALVYKKFLSIFLESDRERIIQFLFVSSKALVFVPILFFLLFYTVIGSVYSSHVIAGLIFTGILSLFQSIGTIQAKYGEPLILELKRELEYVIRLLPKENTYSFIFRKVNRELLGSTFIYSILSYGISVLVLFLFVTQSIWVLVIGFLFIITNYGLSFIFFIAKLTGLYVKRMNWSLAILMPAYLAIVTNSIELNRLYPFHLTNLLDYFLPDRQLNMEAHIYLLCGITFVALIVSLYFIYSVFRKGKIVSSLVSINEGGFYKGFQKKVVFQRLILRVLYDKNKLLYIRIGSIFFSLLIILCYPVLSKHNQIPLVITVLFFCYSPSVFNLMITHFLYDEILQKNFTNTTYYFLRRYQCKKYLYKETILATISQLSIILLPFLTLCLLYQTIQVFFAVISYFLIFLILVTLLVIRIYGLGKFTIEEVKMVEPSVLTSKSTENFILFGIPIIYAIPMVSLIIVESNLFYAYISMVSYVVILLIYCLSKVYVSLSREGKDVTNM